MLLKADILQKLASGGAGLAFRRWRKPTVKAGGRLRTAAGVVVIGAVEAVDEGAVDDGEARKAGYESLAELRASLGGREGRLFRIELQGLEPDERVLLCDVAELSTMDIAAIRARFRRWDAASRPGHHLTILRLVSERPEVAAGALAEAMAVEKQAFKRTVRKLKEIGLTESLDLGYRLSPRGAAVLAALEDEETT